MAEFLTSILDQVSSFYQDELEVLFVRESVQDEPAGFICSANKKRFHILAAKGKYERYINKNLEEIDDLALIYQAILENSAAAPLVTTLANGKHY